MTRFCCFYRYLPQFMSNGTILRFRRSGLGIGESRSEPNLATGQKEYWLSGFPPGLTVDELRWYRKKKPPGMSYIPSALVQELHSVNYIKMVFVFIVTIQSYGVQIIVILRNSKEYKTPTYYLIIVYRGYSKVIVTFSLLSAIL